MDISPNLSLPYIAAAQAQKHVTHNEAVRALDAIVQIGVIERNLATPPGSASDGQRYIVPTAATGSWAGKTGQIAAFQDGAWAFFVPQHGWLAWVADEALLVVWSTGAWQAVSPAPNPVPMVGINATADTANRLTVAAPATLLSHDGSGHQVKINKAADTHTASLLFQTGFSGRAEIGTVGNSKLQIKTSADGATWATSLVVDPATNWIGMGGVTTPEGPLHIVREATNPLLDRIDNTSGGPGIMQRRARGTVAAKTASVAGDAVMSMIGQGYDGSNFSSVVNLRGAVDTGTITAGSIPGRLEFSTMTPGLGVTTKFEVTSIGSARPGLDNAYSLGDSSRRWTAVWAQNGVIQTSDARDKRVVGPVPASAGALVDAIEPVLFKWAVGGQSLQATGNMVLDQDDGGLRPVVKATSRPGRRVHAGFLAQNVKAALEQVKLDIGAWGVDEVEDPASRQWLRPDQLIAVLWQTVRDARQRIAALEARQKSS